MGHPQGGQKEVEHMFGTPLFPPMEWVFLGVNNGISWVSSQILNALGLTDMMNTQAEVQNRLSRKAPDD